MILKIFSVLLFVLSGTFWLVTVSTEVLDNIPLLAFTVISSGLLGLASAYTISGTVNIFKRQPNNK